MYLIIILKMTSELIEMTPSVELEAVLLFMYEMM